MNRTSLNYAIDAVAFFLLLGLAFTGFVIWWPLPLGTNRDMVLWGLSRHGWGDIHAWLAIGFLLTIATHLVLHGQWLAAMTHRALGHKPREKSGVLRAIVIGLLLFVALSIVAALFGARRIEDTCASLFVAEAAAEIRVPFPVDRCLRCHGATKEAAGLRFDESASVEKLLSPDAAKFLEFLRSPPTTMKRYTDHRVSDHEAQLIVQWVDRITADDGGS